MLKVSWSGLRRYESCAQRHKLVISGKSATVRNGRDFLPGTVADRVMRAWLSQDEQKPGEMVEMVQPYFDRYADEDSEYVIRWRGKNDRAVTANLVREAVRQLEPILFKLVVPHEYEPEFRFDVPISIPYLDGHMTSIGLIGGIDLAVVDKPPDVALYDLKITKNPQYVRKTLGQAIFYDIAFGHWYGRNPRSFDFIMPLCSPMLVPVHVTEDDRRQMMARVIKMAHGMWRKEWETNRGSQCRYCEVKPACPEFVNRVRVDARGQRRIALG